MAESSEFTPNLKFLPWFARVVTGIGKTYNGFEAHGLEHIPKDRGALVVMYHGLVPLDYWYLGLDLFLKTGRPACALVDRFLLKTPGLSWLVRNVGGVVGHPETAAKLLRQGVLVGVSPGGVREAISGTHNNYRVIWGRRTGFAQLAIDAGVEIIPGFTENIEEMYRAPLAGTAFFQRLYDKTRLPLIPIIGLGLLPFPVKLRTWLGEPIKPRPNETAAQLAERTKKAIETLISQHQKPYQSILGAIKDRLNP